LFERAWKRKEQAIYENQIETFLEVEKQRIDSRNKRFWPNLFLNPAVLTCAERDSYLLKDSE